MAQSQEVAGLLFNLSHRAKLRISGGDRLRFLNGQITNDVRKASPSEAIEACILSAKGKMNAHVFISSGPDCYWVDADAELREALPARLGRYVIADDVEIEIVDERFSIFHVVAPSVPAINVEGRVISVRRFIESGWDIWVDSASRDQVFQELSANLRFIDDAAAERFRIAQGIPRWGRELTEEIIPIEANLEDRTVDYEKGCYIGQEVISRIKMSGQTNKRLCGLVSSTDAPLPSEGKLVERKKEVGWITSIGQSDGKEIGLGYVKRGFNDIGRALEAVGTEPDKAPISVEIVPLPFQ